MGVLNKGKEFGANETVTSDKLHQLVEDATFSSGAVDGVSIVINPDDGKLKIENQGVKESQLGTASVSPIKIKSATTEEFAFTAASALRHRSYPGNNQSHSSPGALNLNLNIGNFFLVNVSANITSIGVLGDAYAGRHFTIILKYSGSITGPADKDDWASNWLLPSGYDGTLTMTDGAYDIISGVIFEDASVSPAVNKYLANVTKNFG